MMDRVKKWLSEGKKVKIFTARADNQEQIDIIKKWLKEQGLEELDVTNIKESGFEEFWDDKAIQVIKNTGVLACDYNNLK